MVKYRWYYIYRIMLRLKESEKEPLTPGGNGSKADKAELLLWRDFWLQSGVKQNVSFN